MRGNYFILFLSFLFLTSLSVSKCDSNISLFGDKFNPPSWLTGTIENKEPIAVTDRNGNAILYVGLKIQSSKGNLETKTFFYQEVDGNLVPGPPYDYIIGAIIGPNDPVIDYSEDLDLHDEYAFLEEENTDTRFVYVLGIDLSYTRHIYVYDPITKEIEYTERYAGGLYFPDINITFPIILVSK